ncbi:alpha/beta hydrolase fold domain-containing protein [Phyllobacterium sp. 22229]|uniref:Alpha/beta hydrolase fold domain-containing protein n=1 Tax=Agrobacterium radiobacter TaxID=362 RepID=A0ABD5LMU7_AGRRD
MAEKLRTPLDSMKLDPEISEAFARILRSPDEVLHAIETPRDIDLVRRQNDKRTKALLEGVDRAGVTTETFEVEAPDGVTLALRVHRPSVPVHDEQLPCLYYLHPGGMIAGTPEGDDVQLVPLVRELGCVATSLAYRLAPEHPAPVGADDCYTGLRWVLANASPLGIDPLRLAVGGASAGGGMAASCTLAAVRDGIAPRFLLLRYPQLDDRHLTPSSRVSWPVWPHEVSVGAWKAVLGDRYGTDEVTPYEAPGRAVTLEGIPPTYIDVGAMDTFRDDCIDFARRLLAADISTELHVYPGCCHGFDLLVPQAVVSLAAGQLAVGALRKAWER